MKKKIIFTIIALLALISLCNAATNTPWDGTAWDITAPDIDQPIGNHYKEMYDLRKGTAIRINKEHETLATSSAGGVHKQGTARMWYLPTASIPNLQPDGLSALDSGDNGMLWHDITTDIVYLLDDYSDPTIGNGWLSFGSFLGDIDVGASKFTVDAATGNTQVEGTLGSTGLITATAGVTTAGGPVTLGAGDDLIGSATSDITMNTNKFTVAGATGDTAIAGTCNITGILTTTASSTLGDGSVLAAQTLPVDPPRTISDKEYVETQTLNPGTVKAWVHFTGTDAGPITIEDGFNISGTVTKHGTGDYTIFWDTDFASVHYAVIPSSDQRQTHIQVISVNSVQVRTRDSAGVLQDAGSVMVIAIGDQ